MADVTVNRIILVEERKNPSTDFFVTPELRALGGKIEHLNLTTLPLIQPGEQIVLVFVRYISKPWMKWVKHYRANISQLIYFMDDDLFDLKAFSGLPWRYRYKLASMAFSRRNWLLLQGATLWVSTPYLFNKYLGWQPQLVRPRLPVTREPQLTLFYHGSSSHRAEIAWLYPVIAEVLQLVPNISFEIIGSSDVNQLYRKLPRVHVLHPMSWPAYQALLARGQRHIGLAPLLDSHFNQARSYTKFFDITQAGAVGVYTSGAIYDEVVVSGEHGLLLPNTPQLWVDAIVGLAQQPQQLARLQQGALSRCQQLMVAE